jgi:hypothetical protein
MGDPWTLSDTLSGIAADLLSFRKFEPFVVRLFAAPAGAWRPVADYCAGLSELPDRAADVFADHGPRFQVAHVPWPESDVTGYSFVLFACADEMWHTTAVYNRAVFPAE